MNQKIIIKINHMEKSLEKFVCVLVTKLNIVLKNFSQFKVGKKNIFLPRYYAWNIFIFNQKLTRKCKH